MNAQLSKFLSALSTETSALDAERRGRLEAIAAWILQKLERKEPARLIFICIQNSRRSHLAQVWAAMTANHFQLSGIETFSGGTEATAMNPRTAATLARTGFLISKKGDDNPDYTLVWDDIQPAIHCFSKKYDHPENPQSGFAAIMVCDEAEDNCPFVAGAEKRFALPCPDPKEADNTPQEAEVYDTRSRQIATEMVYLFEKVKSGLNQNQNLQNPI